MKTYTVALAAGLIGGLATPAWSATDRPILLAMATPPQSAPKPAPQTTGQSRDYNKVVAVAGIRGLNEEELRKAKYDAEQIKQLNSQAVTADEARKFAAEGGLSSRKVAYLPKPANSQTLP